MKFASLLQGLNPVGQGPCSFVLCEFGCQSIVFSTVLLETYAAPQQSVSHATLVTIAPDSQSHLTNLVTLTRADDIRYATRSIHLAAVIVCWSTYLCSRRILNFC